MKKIVLALVFAITGTLSISAQTLQFSQVKMITSVQTVPVGKVWKVESALGGHMSSNCSNAALHTIAVNGSNVTVTQSNMLSFNSYCGGWSGVATVTTLPIWLPEGSTLAAGANVTSLSVIEFTVVP